MCSINSTLPAELVSGILVHTLKEALVQDLFYVRRSPSTSTPRLACSTPILVLSQVCSTWRHHLNWVFTTLLDTPPNSSCFPLFRPHLERLRDIQAQVQTISLTEQEEYRMTSSATFNLAIGTPPQLPTMLLTSHAISPPVSPLTNHTRFPCSLESVATLFAQAAQFTATFKPQTLPLPATNTPNHIIDIGIISGGGPPRHHTNNPLDQSCLIDSISGARALDNVRQAKRLAFSIRPSEIADVTCILLEELESDVAQGLQVCRWKDTLERVFFTSYWNPQSVDEAHQCFLEIESNLSEIPLALLIQTDLISTVRRVSRLGNLPSVKINGQPVDWIQRAHKLSLSWTCALLSWGGSTF